jgi:uncharacterized protein YbaR (Trm112 family)
MASRAFERRPVGSAELDLCFDCHAIWFDAWESVQLTPGSVIELFRLIHEHRDAPQRPLADASKCPRCTTPLALTHDIQRTTRITYYRCVHGHGRLTTFFQFLREKSFIRSLSGPEIDRLKVTIRQVRCSCCGGPVSVERDAACPYCRAPLSILDAEAVDKALAQLGDQEAERRRKPDPTAAMDAALASQRFERTLAHIEGRPVNMNWGVDLVAEALGALIATID